MQEAGQGHDPYALAIKNRIVKNEAVDIDRLTPFQGNLKTLDDARFNKLRKSLIDEGFSFTVHVWENADVIYIIDGHQRVSVLSQMRKQGYEIPLINCAFLSAKTYREAKKLVLLAVSQYGKLQKQGFADFVQGEEFDFEDFDFPDLTFDLKDLTFTEPEPEPIDDPDSEQQAADPVESEPEEPIDDFDHTPPARVNLGDVWRLGAHILVCGDSGNTEKVHSVIPFESADCVVSDPPYGLSFMGKEWDRGVPSKELWEVWNSRLKPGAHVLSFSGTRTYHLMTVAIENAGFEIRDMMQWIYGQGFPKSTDISKQIDKAAGAEREVTREGNTKAPEYAGKFDNASSDTRERRDNPATPEAKQWEGWGTALKPANEPICLARKPLSESTVAKNVLKHGTGGLNIDGTRVGTEVVYTRHTKKSENSAEGWHPVSTGEKTAHEGRFPSNVLFDEDAARVLDEQTGVLKSGARDGKRNAHDEFGTFRERERNSGNNFEASEGGASRFFYVAKPSKAEKGKENHHATVKPVSLMQYLVRMVCQPSGMVLEPFAGSGTTLLACEKEGMACTAFELDPKHCDIILSRWEKLSGQQAVLVTGG